MGKYDNRMFNIYKTYDQIAKDISRSTDKVGAAADALFTRINEWYIKPAQKLEGNDGFACLCIIFPVCDLLGKLYYKDAQSFSKFLSEKCGFDKKISDALYDFRCGVLHNGLIHKQNCGLAILQKRIVYASKENNAIKHLYLDPWRFREFIINKFCEFIEEIKTGTDTPLISRFKKKFQKDFDIDITS